MKVLHFYHAWCPDERWKDPVREHLDALGESGFPSPVHLGVVGADQTAAIAAFGPTAEVVGQAQQGFEQVTLRCIRPLVARDGAVLYAHTKSDPDDRRLHTEHVVRNWRFLLERLEEGYDVACYRWMRHGPNMWAAREQKGVHTIYEPKPLYRAENTPHASSNFWMATCGYLRGLPPIRMGVDRYDAEKWLGLGDPRVFSVMPS